MLQLVVHARLAPPKTLHRHIIRPCPHPVAMIVHGRQRVPISGAPLSTPCGQRTTERFGAPTTNRRDASLKPECGPNALQLGAPTARDSVRAPLEDSRRG